MSDLKYFTLTGYAKTVIADSSDEDFDPETTGVYGRLTITPKILGYPVMRADDLTPPTLLVLGAISAVLDNGRVKLRSTQDDVRLVAKCSALGIGDASLTYTLTPSSVTAGGMSVSLPTITFEAPTVADDWDDEIDGEVVIDLTTVEWLSTSAVSGGGYVIRHVPDDVRLVGDSIQFYAAGSELGEALDISGVVSGAAIHTEPEKVSLAAGDEFQVADSAAGWVARKVLWSTALGSVASASMTLTGKTISGASNTLSDIPQSAVTSLTTDLSGKAAASHTHAQADITNLVTDLSGKEPTISAGTTAQYWRGDKSWQTLDKSAVGLGNVDNTSDATKDAANATLTNKTISGASNTLSDIGNSALTNSAITIAGTSTSLGGSISQDTITGLSTTGLVKRTGANTLGVASAGTDFVAPGGALGTPSSGTLTNCTGLPVAGIAASTVTALGVGSVELGHASDTTLTRVSAGVLAVEGVTVATASNTLTMTGKTLTSPSISSPTITGTVTATMLAAAQTSAGVKSVITPLQSFDTAASTLAFEPGEYNELAYNNIRGGSLDVTLNGGASSLSDSGMGNLFVPGGMSYKTGLAVSDVLVLTVTMHKTFQYNNYFGIAQRADRTARDVTIELYNSGNSSWSTVYTNTGNTTGLDYVYIADANTYTKIRYTLTNFNNIIECDIRSLFAFGHNSRLSADGMMSRDGGAIYGTNAAPPTFTATSADSNVSINMVPKGTGTLNVSGVPVVTTTGTVTLTNKTLTSPIIGTSILDTNGNVILGLSPIASAVNYLQIQNAITAANPHLIAVGSDANISMSFQGKGTGGHRLNNTNGIMFRTVQSTATIANYITATGEASGTNPKLTTAFSADTNVSLNLATKGTGQVLLNGVAAVDVSSAQTLTSKTLTSPTISSAALTGTAHAISSGGSLSLYNTADQTTNFEKFIARYSSNVLEVGHLYGGTGSARAVRFGTGASAGGTLQRFIEFNGPTSPFINLMFTDSATSGTTNLITVGNGASLTQNASLQVPFAINPTVNQSGTAGYTMLLVNPTQTATGSGAKLLADFQVGGVSKASIDNTGVITSAGATVVTTTGTATLTGKTLTEPKLSTATPASASATGTTGTVVWDASYIYVCTATDTWKRAAIATW